MAPCEARRVSRPPLLCRDEDTPTQPAVSQFLSALEEKQGARFRGHEDLELPVTWFLPGHTVECLEEIWNALISHFDSGGHISPMCLQNFQNALTVHLYPTWDLKN